MIIVFVISEIIIEKCMPDSPVDDNTLDIEEETPEDDNENKEEIHENKEVEMFEFTGNAIFIEKDDNIIISV